METATYTGFLTDPLATLEYVRWWNNQRLHGELEMRTPLEVEAAYYAAQESAQPALAGQGNA